MDELGCPRCGWLLDEPEVTCPACRVEVKARPCRAPPGEEQVRRPVDALQRALSRGGLPDAEASATELVRLAEQTGDAGLRARCHFTRAVLARNELLDVEKAAEALSDALDADPHLQPAFGMLKDLLGRAERWKELERGYRKQLYRLSGAGGPAQGQLQLWQELGELYRDRLGHLEAAEQALQMAARLRAAPR